MNFKSISAIINFTFRENVKNKTYYITVLFGIVLLVMSMLLSVLGGEESVRVILDFGLAAIELFAVLIIVFSGVNIILEEMSSKTIYLTLARPIPRWYYLIGKYLGLLFSTYVMMFIMAVIHILLLLYSGWIFDSEYLLAIAGSAMKIAIIGSLAMYFSLFSTSAVSSLVFTFLLWFLGHFSPEFKFLISKITGVIPKLILSVFYYIIPNLAYYNWRDYIGIHHPGLFTSLPYTFIYGILYSAVFLVFSIIVLNKKEF